MEMNNHVKLSGTIAEEPVALKIGDKNIVKFVLSIARLSGVNDRIPVVVYEDTLQGESLSKGESLILEGRIHSASPSAKKEKLKPIRYVVPLCIKKGEVKTLNEFYLKGIVVSEPIFKVSPLGRRICDLKIISERPNGKTDYFPCLVWGRNAYFMENAPIGTEVELTGRVQSRDYTTMKDGTPKEETIIEISVSRIDIVGKKELNNITNQEKTK